MGKPRKRWIALATGIGAVLGSIADQYFQTNFASDLIKVIAHVLTGQA